MNSKIALWGSYVMSAIPGLMVLSSGINVARKAEFLLPDFARQGIPVEAMPGIGAAAILASVLYLIPRTSVLGAILMTGYFGGAVFDHVRIGEPYWPGAVLFGVLTWGGLYLRNERLRSLIPLTTK